MQHFIKEFPELGRAECRVIVVVDGDEALPADHYALLEMHCDEHGCDCRRVSLQVVSEKTGDALCVIGFGLDRDRPLSGPFIDPLHRQARFAGDLLELVDDLVLSDPKYLARLERHYRMFKEKVCGDRQGGRQVARVFGPVRLSQEQVAERIRERKQRHKSLRRARKRRWAR